VIKKYNFSVLKIENSGNGNSGIKIIFSEKKKIVSGKIYGYETVRFTPPRGTQKLLAIFGIN